MSPPDTPTSELTGDLIDPLKSRPYGREVSHRMATICNGPRRTAGLCCVWGARFCRRPYRPLAPYSHSIVPGGFEVTS